MSIPVKRSDEVIEIDNKYINLSDELESKDDSDNSNINDVADIREPIDSHDKTTEGDLGSLSQRLSSPEENYDSDQKNDVVIENINENDSNKSEVFHQLNSPWALWSHECSERNWRIESFSNIINFRTIEEFWRIYNNFHTIGGLGARDYFLMRETVLPIWEDPANKNGKVWSIQVPVSHIENIWTELSMALVGEYLINEMDIINGISLASKDNCYIIKLWIKNLSKDITMDLSNFLNTKYQRLNLSIKSKNNRAEY